MKRILFAAAAAIACGGALAQPISYPGSTWGGLIYPSGMSGPENGNLLLSGRAEQGAVWLRFGNESQWRLNTYVAVSYSADSEGLGYNNKLVPALGVKLQHSFPNGMLDLGVQVAHERRFRDRVTSTGAQAFASWWFGWNLK